jgi:hypothetical protein
LGSKGSTTDQEFESDEGNELVRTYWLVAKKHLQLCKLEMNLLEEATNYFRGKNIKKAIAMCKTMIENNPLHGG